MKKSTDMPILKQERHYSGNPDLGEANVFPRATEFDLEKCFDGSRCSNEGDFTFKSPKTGNQVRKDGRS